MIEKPLVDYLKKLIASGMTSEDFMTTIKKAFTEYTTEDIDESFIDNLFLPFIELLNTKEPSSEEQRKEALENTLQQYFTNDFEHYQITKNHLLELSFHDKLVMRDNKMYFIKIDLLLMNYAQHIVAIKEWDRLDKLNDTIYSGVALSRSTTPKSILSSHYNQVTNLLKTMPNNKELEVRKKVYDEHLKDPLAINYMLHAVSIAGEVKSIQKDKYDHIVGSKEILNSAYPLRKSDLYKSANISILNLFNPIYLKLSNTKFFDINEVLMQNIFEVSNILNSKNIQKVIQVKTHFLSNDINVPVYELQTNKNKKLHPAFEETIDNQEYWDDILEFFKGKIPLKQSR